LIACSFFKKIGSTPGASKTFQPHRCGLISITVTASKLLLFLPNELKRSGEHDPVSERINRGHNERPDATVSPMIRLKRSQATFDERNGTNRSVPVAIKPKSAPIQISGEITRKMDGRRFNKGNPQNLRPAPAWPKGVSANPGGRPRRLADAVNEELDRVVRVPVVDEEGKTHRIKMTRRQAMAMSAVDTACSTKPHNVAAFRMICELVEPTAEEQRGSTDREFIRLIAQICMERKPKAIEVSTFSTGFSQSGVRLKQSGHNERTLVPAHTP
jgi:uncharacterized protein DUF5681